MALFDSMRGRLESSPIVFEFLQIMRETSALPLALNWMQPVLVRAVELIPGWIRQCLGLTDFYGLRRSEKWMVRLFGNLSNKIVLSEGPRSSPVLGSAYQSIIFTAERAPTPLH